MFISNNDLIIEEFFIKTNSKASHKKDSVNYKVKCYVSECNPDCCRSAFQRLDKLRNQWALLAINPTLIPQLQSFEDVKGNGSQFNPNKVKNKLKEEFNGKTAEVATSAFVKRNGAGPGSSVVVRVNNLTGANEIIASNFVNTLRYPYYEECGKLDQITGWSIDIETGDLYLYQDLPKLNLLQADSRLSLLEITHDLRTSSDNQKLINFELFYKLSLKAIKKVEKNLKTEGNICEISDKCDNKYLFAINTFNNVSIIENNTKFAIVVTKLC